MQYREPIPIERSAAIQVFKTGSYEQICEALVGVVFHEPDYDWVLNQCLEFCDNPDERLQQLAVTCIGHLAHIYRKIDIEKVGPVLERLQINPLISGTVDDAWDDIEMFTQHKRPAK